MMFLVMLSTLVMIRVTGKELRAEEVGLKHKDAEVRVFLYFLGFNMSVICQVLRQGFHLHNFYQLCRGEVRDAFKNVLADFAR